MNGVLFQTKVQEYLSPSQQPFFLPHNTIFPPPVLPPPPPPPSVSYQSDNTFNKISPSILLIIIILAIIFFISGLLHLLVRFLFRPTNRDPEDLDNVTALQGQLQQLFHLHDSGVDQSYIDTLPVFLYKAIIGLKNPFDCAVCLCEFEADDKLRLLPKCSHAFHLECIDTWLLSHSTCPICRGSLLPEFPYNNNGGCYPPVVLVLESGSESSREFVSGRDLGTSTNTTTITGTGNQIGCLGEDEFGSSRTDCSKKLNEISEKEESASVAIIEEKVVTVKLGKFRNVDPPTAPVGQGEASNNSNVDARRCFSMGSFEYVMDETSSLQVLIIPQVRKQSSKKPSIPLTPGHRTAMSECDCHSSREGFRGFDTLQIHSGHSNSNRSSITSHKKDSFSFSKIWLRSKKEKPSSSSIASSNSSSKRAFSFRIPLQKVEAVCADDFKSKESNNSSRRTISEMDVSRWESSASEMGFDEETGSHNSLDSQPSMPSFARRTILWLAGKQNKVVHSSSTNV